MRLVILYLLIAGGIWALPYMWPELRKVKVVHKRRLWVAAVFGLVLVSVISIIERSNIQ